MTGPAADPFAFSPQRIEKPWGYELIWALAEAYCGKILFIQAEQALSLQYHEVKDESWYVQEGRAELELATVDGDDRSVRVIAPGDCFRFRPHTVHRVRALEDTLILEVSTPQLDDVVRLQDDYGRVGS